MGCGSSNKISDVKEVEHIKDQQNNVTSFIKENKKQIKDNYVIKNKLGEGSFGVVKRIIQNDTNEEKALKIIHKKASDKEQESKLILEIDILKQLDHPSILKMYEFYQDQKSFMIVTEMIQGGELFDKIADLSQFCEADAAYIFNQLISVVQYSHEKKIMHRDLKPENILLEYNQNSANTKYAIKVIDWGSATKFTDKKETKQVGTPYYTAPEIFKRSYTEKCDIWTCGVILYIMLTGEPPFYGNENELAQRILDIDFQMDQDVWKGISQDCKDLINKMICPEQKRYTAKDVQQSPWVTNYVKIFKDYSKDSNIQNQSNQLQLTKLKKFSTKNRLHQAVLSYISSQLTSKKDLLQFKQIFEKMDKNNDGSLTKEEIQDGYKQYQEYFNGDYDIDQIFQNIDLDGNGKINYSEFITASIEQESAIGDYQLQKAFNAFDADGNQFITKDELKQLFSQGQNDQEKQIQDIISQFDKNNDGHISFDEFKNMIKKYGDKI